MNKLTTLSYFIFLLPFLGFIINGLFLKQSHKKLAGFLSVALNGAAALIAIYLAFNYFQSGVAPGRMILWQKDFLSFAPSLIASVGLLLDPLSAMMLVVITFISFAVHIYSIGYMKEDRSTTRFFSFLSLFTFSMLSLVVAPNLFQTFFFWELVGISSYLLIGFWYEKPAAVSASKQAFILTRFADSFFLLGIILVSFIIGSFDFYDLNTLSLSSLLGEINLGIITITKAKALFVASILIFIGGWGKSAMFPMHIWLPNAMEGPTPVSSIIHSATMVVAGVYLVARLFPFFSLFSDTLHLIMVVGIFTAVFAAVIACTQKDIKRILAYSTLSQLGYMMFALGSTSVIIEGQAAINTLGYSASVFHVFTHAFFKCMLFLIAGSLIHAVHSNDLDQMGGLGRKMPWTYAATLIGCLAISGIPPFSGFFSKDEILIATLEGKHFIVFGLALFTSGLTAFYMFRLFFLAFHGNMRSPHASHIKESFSMTFPIVMLAIPSFLGGYLFKKVFLKFYLPGYLPVSDIFSSSISVHWVPFAASLVAIIGIVFAWVSYGRPYANVKKALDETNRNQFYKWIYHKFYFDEIYYAFVRQFIFRGFSAFVRFFEDYVIGGAVKGSVFIIKKAGELVRESQSGFTPFYLGTLVVGLLLWRFLGNLPV